MAFDIMDIVRVILESLQGISILIIIFGMASAFLWKVAFYIQLALGLIVTIIVTYFVYSFTLMFGLPITWAILVFVIGVIASLIQAARAAIMAILNGFFLTWLGAFLFLAAGQAIDLIGLFTRLGGTLITSAIIAAILVGISAYAGGHITSVLKFPKMTRSKTYEPEREKKYVSQPRTAPRTSVQPADYGEKKTGEKMEVEKETRIVFQQNPSKSSCGICREEWLLDSEIFRCAECGTNFHRDCIREYLGKSHRCPKCQTTAKMSLN